MARQYRGFIWVTASLALLISVYALYILALGVQTVLAEQTGGWSAVGQGVMILLGASLLLGGLLRVGPVASWGGWIVLAVAALLFLFGSGVLLLPLVGLLLILLIWQTVFTKGQRPEHHGV